QGDLAAALALDQTADHVELALERRLVRDVVPGLDDQLPDDWRGGLGDLADEAVVHRDVAPPDRPLPLGGDRLLDQLLADRTPLGVTREVADTDAVAPGPGQVDS